MARMRPMSGVMSRTASVERRGCNGEQQNHCERSASSSQYPGVDDRHGSPRGMSMNRLSHIVVSATVAWLLAVPANAADINVGLITSMTGPNASIGIPYAKGTAAGVAYKDEVDGVKIRVQQLDDSSDPTTGARDAHKLIEEDKVDGLRGAGNTPITLAIAAYSREQKVPLISLVPLGNLAADASSWLVSIPQPAP